MNAVTTKPTLTVQEAARFLGISEPTVLRRLYAGELEGEKLGKSWAIPADQVEQLVSERRATLEEYAEASDRAEALAAAVRTGYWTTTGDVVGLCGKALAAYREFAESGNAEPVVIKARIENLEDQLEQLLAALLARRGYAQLAGDAAELQATASRLGQEAVAAAIKRGDGE